MLDRKTKTRANLCLSPLYAGSEDKGYLWGGEVGSAGEGHEGASGLLSCSSSSAGYAACSPGGHTLSHLLSTGALSQGASLQQKGLSLS